MPRENHCGECCCLKGNIEERACQLALYIIENKATVRSAAQRFGISKSTVHKDLSERLPAFNKPLYLQVKQVLDENKAERHIRGGIATRKKYKHFTNPNGKHTINSVDKFQNLLADTCLVTDVKKKATKNWEKLEQFIHSHSMIKAEMDRAKDKELKRL